MNNYNKINNINNKIKKRNNLNKPKINISTLIGGTILWIITTIIITSFISISCNGKVIDFLYPENKINNIPSNILDNKFTNLIKNINNKVFDINCDNINNNNQNNNNQNNLLFSLLKIFGIDINGSVNSFENYFKKYNCDLIINTLKSQTEMTNNILKIFEEKSNINENFRNITKILVAPIMFIMKPFVLFFWGYLELFREIINKTIFDNSSGYNLLFKMVFSFINFFIINFFVILPVFSIKVLIHLFTFTLLPFIIMKNNCNSNINNIISKKGVKPFLLLLFVLFNIPFWSSIYNTIIK